MTGSPIKVAYLDYSNIFAGAERALCTIVNHLDRQQITPIVIFPYPMAHHDMYHLDDTEIFYLSPEKKWWMGSEYWEHAPRGADILKRFIFGIKLARLLKREKVDILHVNLLRRDSFMWMYPSKKQGVKIVAHFRSDSLEWIAPRYTQRCCNLIICVSQFNKDRLLSRGTWTNTKVVYDSIASSRLRTTHKKNECKAQLGIAEDCFLISSVGQLQPHKGHDKAIQAFAQVYHSHKDVILYIAGGGTSSELHRLKSLVAKYPEIKSHVLFSGKQVDMVPVYKASDLVLSLSQRGEAFGLVPYEAAYMKTPFIAPNRGAVKEFITHKTNGLLVSPCDVDEITQTIEWVISSPKRIDQLINAAYKTVSDNLDPVIMTEKLSQIYQGIFDEPTE